MNKRNESFFSRNKDIIQVFLTVRLSIYFLAYAAYHFIQREAPAGHYLWHAIKPSTNTWLRIWERWDALHYLSIATNGYGFFRDNILNTAFFPLYPLLGGILKNFVISPTLALLIISNISFFFALKFLYKLLLLDYDEKLSKRVLWYISISPCAFFFAGIYTESLLLLNLVASLYYIRKRDWKKACFWGILLTSTKIVGLAIIPVALWEYWVSHQKQIKNFKIDFLFIPLMVSGLLAFFTYNYITFNDFTATFDSSTRGWGRSLNWPWISVNSQWTRMLSDTGLSIFPFNLFFTFAAIGLVIWKWKTIRFSYVILTAILILLPMCSSTLNSILRYLVVIFPIFIILADLGENEKIDKSIWVGFLVFLGLFVTLFVNWYYIA